MANFTKQAIKAAFLELLDEKPLNKISVRDIVERCGINRNSFYYHFQDIPSLLGEIIIERTNDLMAQYPTVDKIEEAFRASIDYAQKNRRAIMHVYNSVSRDTFEASVMRLCAYMTEQYLKSAYPDTGISDADRELLQVMSYEPAVLLMSVGLYLATDSFDSIAVTGQSAPIIVYSAPIFLALLAVLTIKLRKSPFDLSYSHHAHQEIVQGVATEMSGGTLAKMTLMHWCETVLFLMWVGMFFVWDNPVSWVVALVVMAATYFVEVLIDNTFARSTWRSCFRLGWGVALVFGLLNLMPILVDVFI